MAETSADDVRREGAASTSEAARVPLSSNPQHRWRALMPAMSAKTLLVLFGGVAVLEWKGVAIVDFLMRQSTRSDLTLSYPNKTEAAIFGEPTEEAKPLDEATTLKPLEEAEPLKPLEETQPMERTEAHAEQLLLDPIRLEPLSSSQLGKVKSMISKVQKKIAELYGLESTSSLVDAKWFDPDGRAVLVERLLTGEPFVIAVGGMSDVAGHGNYFNQSYPIVARDALRPVFEAALVPFDMRNMAMGDTRTYPDSLCMEDKFGADVDIVVWDFRMVEPAGSRDTGKKSELYVRQAMMLPKAPLVMYKRDIGILRHLKYARKAAALHVIDETQALERLHRRKAEAIVNDSHCNNQCRCPGRTNWHAGWKTQRFRGLHIAANYLDALAEAVSQHRNLLKKGAVPPRTDPRWEIQRPALHKPVTKDAPPFFRRVTVAAWLGHRKWGPRSSGEAGLSGWKMGYGTANERRFNSAGRHECNYKDSKKSLHGKDGSKWAFFKLPGMAPGGSIFFCGSFWGRVVDKMLVLVNQEEVQDKLTSWWGPNKPLSIHSACYSTTHSVVEGENILGFRINDGTKSQAVLSHIGWQPPQDYSRVRKR
eukprot:CAMPEP_0117602974 /NCGR_PEP_ID=MMETSP0784-20121206/77879_1 /TAXON_ID=39447 /ORGANISM="" /LENGTH=592 /DNA_ID=CAMNT_0005405853 /DNA_START=15 /DNA_END=1790 /DNA_ORIENTATION=-